MARIGEDVATHVAESSADKAMQELKYLCCYKTYVDDFEEEKTSLIARRNRVLKDIEVARHRNENQVEDEVKLWLERANGLIGEDTKGKKKWFGLVTNCPWQYKRGKELEGKTQRIKQLLLEQSNFARVARSTGLPGIEFYSSSNFITSEDRKLISQKLKEALNDDNKFMIGLYGLGGTGKTTMAIEVGEDVGSKLFDKVIFNVVSKDANLKNIRDNIAKHLDFPLPEGKDVSEQAQKLWKRIAEGGEKVLIILDDMWEKLTPQDIGIPPGRHGKGHCAVLLTTRNQRVCIDMGCHEIIELKVLNEEDAVNLLLSNAGMRIDGAPNGFKDVARGIVKECGSLPVAIVAVASALKSRPLSEWRDSLKRLQNHEGIHDVPEDLKLAYNSLRLSYDNLRNENAQKLFLLCSLFPEDYEIPIELSTRIAIGVGLCGEANIYSVARSHFTPIKNELIDSCLLSKVDNEGVKMLDLVRKVALWIGNKQVQVAMDSNTTLMENIQYSSWNIIDFPNHFDGKKLEVLLLWINDSNSPRVKVPDATFEGMENLKILALMSSSELKISAASLFQSPLSFTNVRTLVIKNFKSLGDISILANLKNLESLELNNCSIIELPKEIKGCQKLRLLEMVQCSFTGRNNPFKVIGSCFQLEELYYASNHVDAYYEQMTTLPTLQRYHIDDSKYKVDFSISGYFDARDLRVYFSNEIFKLLVAKAEVLMLGRDYDYRGWKNIVPDILSVKDDNMKDQLTRLYLDSMSKIKCLIHTESLRPGVAIFSKLVKLTLHSMGVTELCHGPYPVDFLKQLKKLNLSGCEKLEGTLFDGKLELRNLKAIYLSKCSMTSLFHASTAQSLMQLEKLEIEGCLKLKYIVVEIMDDQDPNQKSRESMFSKLKYLKLICCSELEFILPICFCEDLPLLGSMKIEGCEKLKYVFGQYPKHRDLHQMGKEAILQLLEVLTIYEVPNFINIYAECYLPRPCSDEVQKSSPSAKVDSSSSLSRGHLCCFWTKSKASTIRHTSAPMNTQSNHNQALKVKYVVNRAHGLFTPPLYPYRSLRSIKINGFSELKSLFTIHCLIIEIAGKLAVENCDALEHIVTDEEHGHDRGNVNSIFPNLRKVRVYGCSHLEYLFPAFYSKDLKHLESVRITKAGMLTRVFGECRADENLNVQVDINLPALKRLDLDDLPNMVGICAKNYSVKELYLGDIRLNECPQLPLKTLMDLLVDGHKRQEDLSRRKVLPLEKKGKSLSNKKELPKFEDIGVEQKIHMSFQNLSELKIQGCKHLKFIFCASTSRWLEKLKRLRVSECEELVSIMEDEENHKNPMTPHQVCFPELRGITVKHCKSLKCLFSESSGKLPRLLYVNIEDVPQLGQVFGWKQGEGRKLVLENVLPKLVAIRLVKLPTLHTICDGIDFQTVIIRHVRQCPAVSLSSANDSSDELLELAFRTIPDEDQFYAFDLSDWAYEGEQSVEDGEASKVIEEDSTGHKRTSISPNLSESEEAPKEAVEKDSIVKKQKSSSPNLTENTKTSTNEIVEELLSASSTAATTSPKSDRALGESCEKESKRHQEALGEHISLHEGPRRVKEATNDLFPKETTQKVALAIPPTATTEMTSPPDPSISTPEKPQITSSTTHTEPKSSQSDLFDISIPTECAQASL
ncbi:uncharacterized protein LOC114712730 [Neltuma alba]|uniref:uncharacterized protein LOC114712730 n=1 Tax=Neltuma alba TaxID=207710 RepID=UPI0010A364C0|nr:uncharacterized protein LOC114712730 [Prosopis alba]